MSELNSNYGKIKEWPGEEKIFVCWHCKQPFALVKYVGLDQRGVSPCCNGAFMRSHKDRIEVQS